LFYHPDKVNKDGKVIFNKDLIKMEINIKNAENIFKKAKEVLKAKIPKAKDCQYCKWANESE
jgi:hypothetical protein